MDRAPPVGLLHQHPSGWDMEQGRKGEGDVALIGLGFGWIEQQWRFAGGKQAIEVQGQLPVRVTAVRMQKSQRDSTLIDGDAEGQRLFGAEKVAKLLDYMGQRLRLVFSEDFQKRNQFLYLFVGVGHAAPLVQLSSPSQAPDRWKRMDGRLSSSRKRVESVGREAKGVHRTGPEQLRRLGRESASGLKRVVDD